MEFDSIFLVAALLLGSIPAQAYVVDLNNGPATSFTSIQAAINGVPEDSMIRIRQGIYQEATFDVIAKSVRIFCDPGVEVWLPAGTTLRVQALAANQRVTLSGFLLRSSFQSSSVQMLVSGNQGRVFIDRLRGDFSMHSLSIINCPWVVVAGATFGGGSFIQNSDVVFENCFFQGTSSAAIQQSGGSVQLVDTEVHGQFGILSLIAGVGVHMQGGVLRMLGDSRIVGGLGFTSAAAPALSGSGILLRSPTAVLQGPAPLVPPTFTEATEPMPHVTTTTGPIGATITASLFGPTLGSLGVLTIGFPGPVTPVTNMVFPAWLQPASVVGVVAGFPAPVSPISGQITVPATSTLRGLELVWQGFTFHGSVGMQASNPSFYTAF